MRRKLINKNGLSCVCARCTRLLANAHRTAGVAMSQTVYHDFPTASGNSGSNSSDGAGSGIGNITTSAVNIVAMSHTIRIHKIYETTVNANIVLLAQKNASFWWDFWCNIQTCSVGIHLGVLFSSNFFRSWWSSRYEEKSSGAHILY